MNEECIKCISIVIFASNLITSIIIFALSFYVEEAQIRSISVTLSVGIIICGVVNIILINVKKFNHLKILECIISAFIITLCCLYMLLTFTSYIELTMEHPKLTKTIKKPKTASFFVFILKFINHVVKIVPDKGKIINDSHPTILLVGGIFSLFTCFSSIIWCSVTFYSINLNVNRKYMSLQTNQITCQ
ncbi:hypothetical protein A3Q56_00628 [Intoshia linei]|uniref:Uncharacterized protein n=1 Tax=Intoshia linei TaxID=1819745 RepID=A0A177BD74_9BILA|nr:hypothetical protein A3Q56_00628 [Intoshia linei]